MNFTIWRATASEFALIACTLKEDRYISVAGIWGIRTKQKRENEQAVFEDETAEGGID